MAQLPCILVYISPVFWHYLLGTVGVPCILTFFGSNGSQHVGMTLGAMKINDFYPFPRWSITTVVIFLDNRNSSNGLLISGIKTPFLQKTNKNIHHV